MDEFAQAIIDSLEDKNSDSNNNANNLENYSEKFFPIDKKNYHMLNDLVNIDTSNDVISNNIISDCAKTLSFIDGGQAIIFDSPRICISILRIGYVDYVDNKRVNAFRKDYQIIVLRDKERFNIRTFPTTEFDNFNISISELSKDYIEDFIPKNVVSIIRRCLELDIASKLTNPIVDGSLDYKYSIEKIYLDKLFTSKSNFGKIIAISKTSNLVLDDGSSVLKKLSSPGSWIYYPLLKINVKNNELYIVNFETTFVKLHESSKYIFRMDISKNLDSKDVNSEYYSNNIFSDGYFNSILLNIKNNSKDPIFLGYPYGLIDVDQYIRISDEEKDYYKIKLSAKLGKKYTLISLEENSSNAHSILDGIKF